MKTRNFVSYCESLGKKEPDWLIILSKNCKQLTARDLDDLIKLSMDPHRKPTSCLAACIERFGNDVSDEILKELEERFNKALSNMKELCIQCDSKKCNQLRKECHSIVKRMMKREGMLVKQSLKKINFKN